jgi:hypothetical protein
MRYAAAAVALWLGICAPAGNAAWGVAASGTGAAKAKTMSGGNTPSASVAGRNVTVTWTASTFPEGGSIPGYVVKRYSSLGGAAQVVLADCAGTVTGTSCTEQNVPIGSWKYSVTPALGLWRGTESGQSAAVTVLL